MLQNKLSFESENLVVDWIGFNIQGSVDLKPIARYLFEAFGFNSTIAKRINGKWKSESLNYDSQNQFQVSFRQHQYDPEAKSFWVGTKIYFSGKNAAQIYNIIQTQKFDWNIFDLTKTSLARFDLCYFRETKAIEQKGDLELFMNKCCQKAFLRSKKNIAEYTRNDQGLILRIGSRKSPNHYRVYETRNGLRFELEMKKAILQDFLFLDHLKNFEDKLTRHFYEHSKKILILDNSYTDWLIDYSRKTEKPINSLVTSYLTSNNLQTIENEKYVFRLLQFLSFSRQYSTDEKYLLSQKYYVIKFPVRDFMDFIQIENKSHYQFKKVIDFLHDLQNNIPPVTIFSDNYFRSAASIPFVEIQKEHKFLVAKVLIAEQLYSYQYPFSFPFSFISYQTNNELQVKLRIIQCMSINSLEKVFHAADFLEQFNVSTQKQAHIKKLIVQSFNELQDDNRIKNKFKLMTKSGLIKEMNKISPLRVGQSKMILFYEKL
jgi:hypothetical protein